MKSNGKHVINHIFNITATLLSGCVALVFVLLALSYRSTSFIMKHQAVLGATAFAVLFSLILAYAIFYIFDKKVIYRLILFLLICLTIFAVVFYAICATGLISKINSIKALREYIEQAGNLAVILFIIFQFLQVIILPVPGSVSVAAGVALFGPFKCALFSFIGITLGSFTAFAIGRVIGFRAVSWIVGKETLEKWLEKVKGKDYLILSLMFLLPLFPDDVLCFVAGLSSMTWTYFIVMITVTRAISVFSTAYSFGFIPLNTWWGLLIWLVLLALIVLSFWFVCKYSDKIDRFIKEKFKIRKKTKN